MSVLATALLTAHDVFGLVLIGLMLGAAVVIDDRRRARQPRPAPLPPDHWRNTKKRWPVAGLLACLSAILVISYFRVRYDFPADAGLYYAAAATIGATLAIAFHGRMIVWISLALLVASVIAVVIPPTLLAPPYRGLEG